MAALRRRSGRSHYSPLDQITPANVQQPRDRLGVEAERKGAAAVRHAARARFRTRRSSSTTSCTSARRTTRSPRSIPTTGKELWRYDPKAYEDGQPPNGQGFAHRGVVGVETSTRSGQAATSHLPQRALQADPARCEDRRAGRDVRQQRRRRSQRRPRLGDQQEALHQHLAAHRLQGPDHRRQRRRRSADLQERSAGRRARVPRADRKAGLEVQHHPAARRVRQQHLGRRIVAVHRPHQRVGADEPRRAARPALHAGQHAEQRLLRRPPARRRTCSPNRLVCLDANTGKRKWHYQIVHHGLWDYDPASAPNLVTITVDGKRIDAVVQLTKQGWAFVFDRVTGKPVWPIEERPVARSDVPGRSVVADAAVPDQTAGLRIARRHAGRCV